MNKKLAYMGLFGAVAIIFGYVEMLFPIFVAVPGVKLGIANLITLLVLYLFSWREAALIALVRICVIGFLFGNLFSILYSLCGAFLSLLIMVILKGVGGFSMAGVSVGGGVSHNVGQLLVAMIIVENFSLLYYLPVLLISGVLTGAFVGFLAIQIRPRILPVIQAETNNKHNNPPCSEGRK